jgi:hypothetical protein
MLSVEDLKRLSRDANKGSPSPRCRGTALKIVGKPSYNLRDGRPVWFNGFNSFCSKAGIQKVSFEPDFGKIGGAECWDDFTPEGKRWIEENYDPERCWLCIATEYDVFGVRAKYLRLI